MPGCKAHIKLDDDDKCEEETHAYTKQNTIRWGGWNGWRERWSNGGCGLIKQISNKFSKKKTKTTKKDKKKK